MTPKHNYNGVARTIREQLRPTHIFIVEMGAKSIGDISEICELTHPHYGIITSIGEQHLETFKTIENIIGTKFELADAIPDDGMLFLNADNSYINNHTVTKPVMTYGINNTNTNYTAFGITVSNDGSSFTVKTPSGEMRHFNTRLLGAHNIQNILGCIAVAHTLGIPLEELVVPIKRLKPVEHRLQLLPNGIIDDSYNSNPQGFRCALMFCVALRATGFGNTGMVELGQGNTRP